MSGKLITAMLIVVGVIHLLPLSGLRGAEQLNAMYGVSVTGADLEILMRHRAVLFGLLGLFLLIAAFIPSLQLAAIIIGTISAGSLVVLAWMVGDYNVLIQRVVMADLIALACLAVAGGLKFFPSR